MAVVNWIDSNKNPDEAMAVMKKILVLKDSFSHNSPYYVCKVNDLILYVEYRPYELDIQTQAWIYRQSTGKFRTIARGVDMSETLVRDVLHVLICGRWWERWILSSCFWMLDCITRIRVCSSVGRAPH